MKKKTNSRILRITTTGIFAALALAFSFAERFLLAALPLPMGIKPGLSNIIVMFVCSSLGLIPALAIAVIKAGFAAILSGAVSGIISLCGGLLSVFSMYILIKILSEKLSYAGISVISAVMHNLGQLTAASVIAGSSLFAAYAPVLLVSGISFGFVTGLIMNIIMPYLKKLNI